MHLSKEYLALVHGKLSDDFTTIDLPIARKNDSIIERCINFECGKKSVTNYKVLNYYENINCSLVNCKLITGRTHQIRVHLQAIGHPLIGDQKYGNSFSDSLAKKYKMKDYFLHAKQLRFIHIDSPLSYLNKKSFVAPLFLWQEKLLQQLSKGGNENECL